MARFIMAGTVLALAATTAVRADEKEAKVMDGTYRVVGLTKSGSEIPEEVRKGVVIKFKGDEMSLVLPDRTLAAKVKLDAGRTPSTIDILPSDGPEKGKTFPGIYKLAGDELTIAFNEKGERPTEFKADGNTVLMKLKKDGK